MDTKKPHQRRMMKLRMTGFECSPTFVILRAKMPSSVMEAEARHWRAKLVSVFQIKLKSFPIVSDVVVS